MLVHVIYTSGSEKSKVEVSLANLEFFIKNLNDTFPSNQNSVFILNTALQFDVSVAELMDGLQIMHRYLY